MGSKKQKKNFTWVLDKFSDQKSYFSPDFVFSGCNWRLRAYCCQYKNDYYLSLYLGLSPSNNLDSGWRRNVEFYITLVNKSGKSNIELGGESCFDANNNMWGFPKFFLLNKLHDRRRGFMVNNTLTIQVEIHVIPGAVTPVRTLSGKEASDENLNDDDDASEESVTDDDDDESEESDDDDDDASEESVTDDDDESEESDDESGIHDDDDETYEEATMDDVEDESEKSSDNNDDASLHNSATMNVNGFEVISSKVESVKRIFERHPDIAIGFRAKNQHLKNSCMNFLFNVIETMSQSLLELSNEDLVEADIALTYLKDAGFKVDWLVEKLDQLKGNKEKEKSGLVRLQEIEEDLMKLKQKYSEMYVLAEKEKEKLSATRTPMSFDDLV